LHNWTIGLCTGQAAAPDDGCTPRFEVRLTEGQVFLKSAELAGDATELTRPVAGPTRRTACA
jgi:nitrite reductase (NADH) small subunit